jgi:hypothetical protein
MNFNMKKVFFTLVLFCAMTSGVRAQDVFNKGDIVFSAGLGIGSPLGDGWKMSVPPVTIAGEYGIVGDLINGRASIGVGAVIDFSRESYLGFSATNFLLGARGAFHYQFIPKLDTYAGLVIGYDAVTTDYTATYSGLVWGLYLGARYYLSERFALMGEFGTSIAWVTLGVAFKL